MSNQKRRIYRTWIFDCDGVILDSNKVKTEAFRQVARPFGEEVVKALVAYHVRHAGASRYQKFAYLLQELLNEQPRVEKVNALARQFGNTVYHDLLDCAIVEGLDELRRTTVDSRWMVVSGGDQDELRRLFVERGLNSLFDGGVFGSPANKDEIITRERIAGNLLTPALFIGDSRYDHETAKRAGIDFVFAHAWTEFEGWQQYAATHHFPVVSSVKELIPIYSA